MGKTLNTLSLRERIEKVVDDFVHKNAMFTLLDISQTVKNDGGTWASHSAMKPTIEEVLKERFSTQLFYAYYTESMINVQTPVGIAVARLFHPVGEDPNKYVRRSQTASPPSSKKDSKGTTVSLASNHPTVVGRKVVKNRKTTSCGYIEIPKAIWKKAGFVEGSACLINYHVDSITILNGDKKSKYRMKYEDQLLIKASRYRIVSVPPSGRFRLAPNDLACCNLQQHELDFSAFTDKIVISKKVQ